MLVWLGICAVFAFAAAWSAWVLGVAPVATVHIAFAFGVMPLVLGTIVHFVPVLTRGAGAGAGAVCPCRHNWPLACCISPSR